MRFGEEERAEAVAIHRPVRLRIRDVEEARLVPVFTIEDVLESGFDCLAVSAATRLVTARHQRQAGQARDGDVAVILRLVAERPVVVLVSHQVVEPSVDGFLCFRRDQLLRIAAVRQPFAVVREQAGRGFPETQDQAAAVCKELTPRRHGSLSLTAAFFRDGRIVLFQ